MIDARRLYITPPYVSRIQQRALMIGAVGLILCFVGAIFRPAQFLQSYLFAYLFTLGLALGSMAILMLQYLTDGDWGVVTRRILEAAMRTLPWLAIGFLPIALGVRALYVWARPAQVAADGSQARSMVAGAGSRRRSGMVEAAATIEWAGVGDLCRDDHLRGVRLGDVA